MNVRILEAHLWPEVARLRPISLTPDPQEFTCVTLWQSFPRNEAHELLGQGGPSVLFCFFELGQGSFLCSWPLGSDTKKQAFWSHNMTCTKLVNMQNK